MITGTKQLYTTREIRQTLRSAFPIVAAQIAQMGMGVVDTIMAGNLSAMDLAAIAMGRNLFMPFHVFILGILMVINPMVAQLRGAAQSHHIGKVVYQALLLSLIIAVPLFWGLRNMDIVMKWMKIQPEIISVTVGYLRALSWCAPATLAYLVLRFMGDGISISKPHMFFLILAIPVNVLGNYILMYGKLGCPRMGAVGAGWVTTLIWWLLFISMVLLTCFGRSYRHLNIYRHFTWPKWQYIKEMLWIGIPNGVTMAMEVSMFAGAGLLIGTLGATAMAAHQVALSFTSIAYMVPLGISIAATSRVGHAIGSAAPYAARQAGNAGIFLALIATAVTAGLMLVLPETIVRIYTEEAAVITIAVQLLFMAALFQFSDGLQVSAAGALRGLKDTRIPMLATIVAYWGIGLPVAYYQGIFYGQGVVGIWSGLIVGLTAAAIAHSSRFYFLMHRKISTAGIHR